MKYVFSLPCDLIVTTRVNPVLWGYEDGILVESLQKTEWDIFFHSYLKEDYEKCSAIIQKQMDYSKGHLTWMLFIFRGIKEIQKKEYRRNTFQIPEAAFSGNKRGQSSASPCNRGSGQRNISSYLHFMCKDDPESSKTAPGENGVIYHR